MAQQLYASWVHGNAAVAEDPAVTVLRQGFGATFNIPPPPFALYFIHIPIPTPVIMGASGRLKLVRVLYLINAVGTELSGIDLYDGKNLILSQDAMHVGGDHTDRPVSFNGGGASGIGHVMEFGLGLTMKVVSGIHWEQEQGQFFVAATGADFVTI